MKLINYISLVTTFILATSVYGSDVLQQIKEKLSDLVYSATETNEVKEVRTVTTVAAAGTGFATGIVAGLAGNTIPCLVGAGLNAGLNVAFTHAIKRAASESGDIIRYNLAIVALQNRLGHPHLRKVYISNDQMLASNVTYATGFLGGCIIRNVARGLVHLMKRTPR